MFAEHFENLPLLSYDGQLALQLLLSYYQLFQADFQHHFILFRFFELCCHLIASIDKVVPVLTEIFVFLADFLEAIGIRVPLTLCDHLIIFVLDEFIEIIGVLINDIINCVSEFRNGLFFEVESLIFIA